MVSLTNGFTDVASGQDEHILAMLQLVQLSE